MLIVNSCKNNNNIIAPISEQTLSVSAVSDSMKYTFAIQKQSFGIHDVLIATMTAYNEAALSKTINVGPSHFSWDLKNDSGRTIMCSPTIVYMYFVETVINSHQSNEIYSIHQAISDTSGAPVKAGSYVLNARLFPFAPSTFSLIISLQ